MSNHVAEIERLQAEVLRWERAYDRARPERQDVIAIRIQVARFQLDTAKELHRLGRMNARPAWPVIQGGVAT